MTEEVEVFVREVNEFVSSVALQTVMGGVKSCRSVAQVELCKVALVDKLFGVGHVLGGGVLGCLALFHFNLLHFLNFDVGYPVLLFCVILGNPVLVLQAVDVLIRVLVLFQVVSAISCVPDIRRSFGVSLRAQRLIDFGIAKSLFLPGFAVGDNSLIESFISLDANNLGSVSGDSLLPLVFVESLREYGPVFIASVDGMHNLELV